MTTNDLELAQIYIDAVGKIDIYGREELGMTPQIYRRYRISMGINAVLAHIKDKSNDIPASN